MTNRLSIYRLKPEEASAERLVDVSARVFGIRDDYRLFECNGNPALQSGARTIELSPASGAVWAADTSQLWKPTLRREVPEENQAISIAERHLHEHKLLPRLNAPFRLGKPTVGGTYYALRQQKRPREERRLDVHVSYPFLVGDIPVVGGGSDFGVTIGHHGGVIAVSGGWRTPVGSFDAKVIERAEADEQFRAITQKMKLESFDARLAYYAAPAFQRQDFLYPVYVYRAKARFGKRVVPLRQIMLPATDFGPKIEFGPAQAPRHRRERHSVALLESIKQERRRFASRNLLNPWEAGTSWIGLSGGLSGSQANAQGFIDEWAADGWRINFNWGDGNAWESDWRRNDDTWVDAADFVFYTGHADMNGWVLSTPDDGSLTFTEVGANPGRPGDLWGQNDLEWAVIAACGPLQDEILSPGGGDVLARWDGAFDGMHMLMGYGAITFDNTDEGRKLAQYAKGGSTLIDAWFRTAREIQPADNGESAPDGPTVWVGSMWVGRDGIDPVHDHAWGHGSVSADPRSPTWLAAMWTIC